MSCDNPVDLRAEVERLRTALAFYADPATHECRGGCAEYSAIFKDDGERARKALGLPEP